MTSGIDLNDGFPLRACILLGVGLGGFVDGILFHQILQWHHMLSSAGWPPINLHNLEVNTLADGLFHAAAWACVVAGLLDLWHMARRPHPPWRWRRLLGGLLLGFGGFNLVEGLVDHQLLGLHHVNETVPREQWLAWDIGFLLWGLVMMAGGWGLLRQWTPRPVPGAVD